MTAMFVVLMVAVVVMPVAAAFVSNRTLREDHDHETGIGWWD